jgi:hypothetical protein
MKTDKSDVEKAKRRGKLYAALTVAAVVTAGVMISGYAEEGVDKALGGYYRGVDDAEVVIKDFSDFT